MRLVITFTLFLTVAFIASASVNAYDNGGPSINANLESRYMWFFHPGQTIIMDFYVENQSPVTDSIVIEAWVSDRNWTYSIDQTLHEDVPPWTRVFFNFSLTAPMNAVAGDHVDVNLTARALNHNVTESINGRFFVIVERKIIVIDLGDEYYELDNTSIIRTRLRVNNTGDLPVNVTMEASSTVDGELIYEGVEVTLEPIEFELLPGEGRNVSVVIEVLTPTHLRSDSEYRTFVRAGILEDKSVWSGARIDWGVAESFEASVDPERSSHRILPNEEISIDIHLTQSTNNHTGHTWRLTMDNLTNGWWVAFYEGPYEVTGPGSFVVDMVVGVPGRTTPGTDMEVEVLFTCDQLPELELRSVLVFEIEEVHFVQFFMAPRYQRYTVEDMTEGSNVKYNVTILNNGNVQEYLAMEIRRDGSPGSETLEFINPRSAGVLLVPYSEYTFTFEVAVDKYTPAKEYWINLQFSWDHVPIPSDQVILEVDPYMNLSCSMVMGPEPVINPNLPEPRVTLTMVNTGNVPVPYFLQWSVLPVGGGVHSRGESDSWNDLHLLETGATRNHTFRLFVQSPEDGEPLDDGSFQLFVLHYDGYTLWDGAVGYSVVYPDLAIVGYDFDAPVRRGEANIMFVAVENRGDGTSPASSIVLIRELTGEELNMTDVPELAPGGSIVLPLGFRLTAEEDTFAVEVDPHREVYEHGYGPNSINMTVSDPAEPPEGPGPTSSFLLGLMLVLGLSTLGYVTYRLVSRRLAG